MTSVSPPPAAPMTARSFLFADREQAVASLARVVVGQQALRRIPALPRLSAAANELAGWRLAEAAADLADVDVGAVLAAGWQRYAALANAGWRTAQELGSEELVDLASHRVASTHHPRVDVLVDGAPVGTLTFDVELALTVRALVATVRTGRLVEVGTGHCTLAASLGWEGLVVAEREAELELDAVLDLGSGVPLVAS